MKFKPRPARKKGKPIELISLKDAAAYVGFTEKEFNGFLDIFKIGRYFPAQNSQPYVERSVAECLKAVFYKDQQNG